jgi:signal transduction histidine kinase
VFQTEVRLAELLVKIRQSLRQSVRRLRVQIIALFLLLGLATALIFSTGTRYAFGYSWRDLTRPLVSDYVDRLAADLGSPPSIERAKNLAGRLPLAIRLSGPTVNWQSDAESSAPRNWPGRMSDWSEPKGGRTGEKKGEKKAVHRAEERDDPARPPMLSRRSQDGHLIEFSLNFSAMEHRPHGLFWLSLSAILLLIGLAYWYVRRLLSPLDEIRAGAMRFGQGEFSRAIAVRSQNELGVLAQEVNSMAKEIKHMLDSKRALLLAMSHELRSPLTRAKVNAELLPEDGALTNQKAAIVADLNQMRDLIQDLLESEQLGAGHRALYLEETDLAQLIQDHLNTLPGNAAFDFRSDPDLPRFRLDRIRIRLLLRNLLDNALRHGVGTGATQSLPEIRLESVNKAQFKLTIRDFGPGVAEAELAKLAQPFYRLDSSRTRATGGVGLGLYLSRLVAQAHGATWSIRNANPGLEISISF